MERRSGKLGLVLTLALGGVANPAAAANAEHVTIDWLAAASRSVDARPGEKPATWKETCKTLGDSLLVGKGLWGFGVFDAYTCAKDGKRVSGPKRSGNWRLTLVDGDESVDLLLEQHVAGSAKTKLAELKLPGSDNTMRALSDPELADIVAYFFLESMPMGMQVTKDMLTAEDDGVRFSVRALRGVDTKTMTKQKQPSRPLLPPPPPEVLVLFRLSWNADLKIWRPSLLGRAQQTAVDTQGASYKADAKLVDIVASEPVWAQNDAGPTARNVALAKDLVASHQRVLQRIAQRRKDAGSRTDRDVASKRPAHGLLTTVSAARRNAFAYLGYGIPLVDSSSLLLPAARQIRGSLVLRDQWPRGLSFETSVAPHVEESFLNRDFALDWMRLAAGVEFGIDPGFLANWLAVTPMMGLWQQSAVLPIRGETGEPLAVDYSFAPQFAMGFRIAAEIPTPLWTAIRLTHGRAITSAMLSRGSSTGAKTADYTIEAMLRGLGSRPVIFPFVYYSKESAVFSLGKASELELVKTETVTNSQSYRETFFDLDFVGAGVGLAW